MKEKLDGGPAFPVSSHGLNLDGMSLRDYFAACFVKGALANSTIRITAPGDSASHIAISAYKFADAMLTEREK